MKPFSLLSVWQLSLAISIYITGATLLFGQGSKADYERAMKLRDVTRDNVTMLRLDGNWLPNGKQFWHRSDQADGTHSFVLVNAPTGKKRPAFNHAKLASELNSATEKDFNSAKLPFRRIEFADDTKLIRFEAEGKRWEWNRKLKELTDLGDVQKENSQKENSRSSRRRSSSALSPDGKWETFYKEQNLWIRNRETKQEHYLSKDGAEEDGYSGRVYWSPDSKRVLAIRTAAAEEHIVYMVESSPKDQKQPKLHSMKYLKPGDRIALPRPMLFEVASRKQIPISDDLFPTPWRLSDFRWSPDSSAFSFLYNQRGHQVLRVISVDAKNGATRTIVDEHSKTFVDYAYKRYLHRNHTTGDVIWMSERDGWNHLYRFDMETGKVRNQITKGAWVVRGVDRIDDAKRQIWFRASGIEPSEDPYYIHYCRVNFDGTGFVKLTAGDGTHSIKYSPDRRFFIDSWSRVDLPPVHELRRSSDGKLICELERSDWSKLLATGWRAPERFVAKARDGVTDIYGIIVRPSNFDPEKTYPVIENIYAGPHGSFVPKTFSSYQRFRQLAELGFIVVKMDGMGTSNRSKKFHDVCWKNLGDSGFPDRILWIKEAAKKYPYMDITRMGIYGGSAGGQSSTRAMLAHGDFYKAAVSDCGCHDNLMDKIWWNELWMSWPIGPHYKKQSNVTQAHRLQGKLMLVVGELDRNVDPASTMQVVNALIKADKDFDLLVVPGGGHGIAESPYGNRRRMDFFVRHLMGKEPRWE